MGPPKGGAAGLVQDEGSLGVGGAKGTWEGAVEGVHQFRQEGDLKGPADVVEALDCYVRQSPGGECLHEANISNSKRWRCPCLVEAKGALDGVQEGPKAGYPRIVEMGKSRVGGLEKGPGKA